MLPNWGINPKGRGFKSVKTLGVVCVAADDENLVIEGYKLIWADHPSCLKIGGVCVYCKDSLAVQLINVNYLIKVTSTTKIFFCHKAALDV